MEETRSGPRRYRNGVALVLPDGGQFDQARQATRTRLAAESLLRQKARYGFTPEQCDELKEKAEKGRRDAATAVSRSYATVVVPVKDRSGEATYELDPRDLRSLLTAGRSLHERVEEALSHRVFNTVTVDKLLSLAGLGPEKSVVVLGDLVDWFYSYFDFTKVWSRRGIAEAVSNAVAAERAGYVVGLVRGDDSIGVREPKMIRLGETLPSDDFDMSADAALLEAGHAHQLFDAARTPVGTISPDPGTETSDASTGAATVMDVPTVTPKPQTKPPGGSRDAVTRVELKATVGKAGLFDLSRALSWLRDNAGAVEVGISINAAAPEQGFDRVKLRNGLIEPLEEASTNVAVDME